MHITSVIAMGNFVANQIGYLFYQVFVVEGFGSYCRFVPFYVQLILGNEVTKFAAGINSLQHFIQCHMPIVGYI